MNTFLDRMSKARWGLFANDELEELKHGLELIKLEELKYGLELINEEGSRTTEGDTLLEEIKAEQDHRQWLEKRSF